MTALNHDEARQTASHPEQHMRTAQHTRNHLAALWAADLLGLIGHAANDYAHDLAHRHKDDESLTHALAHDLRGRMALAEIKAKLSHLWNAARHPRHK